MKHHRLVTSGELLFAVVHGILKSRIASLDSHRWLTFLDGAENWSEYIEFATTLYYAGRFLRAAQFYGESDDRAVIERQVRSVAFELLSVESAEANVLTRRAIDAVKASQSEIATGIRNKVRSWAESQHKKCYLCGEPLSFALNQEAPNSFTADHIWPKSFGGEPIIDNILPACKNCNSYKKHCTSWAHVDVQSVLLRVAPSEEERTRIDGRFKFALHHRAAKKLAEDRGLTLKESYLRIGPWNRIADVARSSDSAHFFNLRNVNPELSKSY
jgi:5-methylcytosine-specific restriction endonuclease McrA